jgi:hypothetical protein
MEKTLRNYVERLGYYIDHMEEAVNAKHDKIPHAWFALKGYLEGLELLVKE